MVIFSNMSYAQQKNDNIWLLGNSGANVDTFGGFLLEFSDGDFHFDKFNIKIGNLLASNASICDDNGDLVLYSNGCSIANFTHEMIENGDGLNPGFIANESCNGPWGGSYLSYGSTLILPIPERPGKYYYIYEHVSELYASDGLFYAHIDMNANGGLGKVLEKNVELLPIPTALSGYITAVRHGNGRDWWIVVPSGEPSRDFYLFLLSPNGLEGPFWRSYPPATELPPGSILTFGGPTQAVFTPDGTKYCRVNRRYGIEIFNFDRCSGEFEILKKMPLPPLTEEAIQQNDTTLLKYDPGAAGMAASPNSRFLYVSNVSDLYQIDLCDKNFKMEHIEAYNGALWYFFAANFYQMQLAPDNRIYMCSSNTGRVLSVINEPNKLGKLCNFDQHGILLPRYTGFVLPNFPHFRLYDASGSPCDTLGIDGPEKRSLPAFTLFPNPAKNEVHIFVPKCDGGQLTVYNAAGQFLWETEYLTGDAEYTLDTMGWPAGVYFATLVEGRKRVLTRKLVIAR
ncbi:MAG: hypothetical protein EPGJADBJ_05394 [Saprospiraceae bacterium]|nr:hypothetical protein [Saprospiraceae bacterium]